MTSWKLLYKDEQKSLAFVRGPLSYTGSIPIEDFNSVGNLSLRERYLLKYIYELKDGALYSIKQRTIGSTLPDYLSQHGIKIREDKNKNDMFVFESEEDEFIFRLKFGA